MAQRFGDREAEGTQRRALWVGRVLETGTISGETCAVQRVLEAFPVRGERMEAYVAGMWGQRRVLLVF